MLHKRRKKGKCPIGQYHASIYNLPSLTFINNLLHSKSTYFYKWWNYTIPSVCILALLVGLYVSVNPNVLYNFSINQVSAWDDITTDPGGTSSGDSDTTEPSLSLIIDNPDQPATNAQPGIVAYRTNSFTVTAKDYNYYAVMLSALRGSDSELRGKNNPFATVEGVGYNVSPLDFRDNTWGYAVTENPDANEESLLYNTAPGYDRADYVATNQPITGTITKTYKITFAAKFGNDMPTDSYQSQLLLSVVGSADKIVFDGIKYMQEMTVNICNAENTPTNNTHAPATRLIDQRDGKSYWVAKLKDGNCWMTQNLDYDIKENEFDKALSTRTGEVNTGWINTYTAVQSWDPGTYYYRFVSASDWTNCGSDLPNMSTCPNNGNWGTTAPTEESEHYHIGNYYSWNAATAGTGNSITSGEAVSSICPSGWKLPTSANSNRGSFQYLINQYGITSSDASVIRQTPLYFVPAGYIQTGGLSHAGNVGYYWSSTPYSNGLAAYSLYFLRGTSLTIDPSDRASRSDGFSVRCLADF